MNYKDTYLVKFLLGFSAYQFIVHGFFLIRFADYQLTMQVIIAFVQDVFLLTIFYLFTVVILRFLPVWAKSIVQRIFVFIFILLGALLSLYPQLLSEYISFPVNIFESDISTVGTLFTDYLGLIAFIPVFFAFLLGLILIKIKKDFTVPSKIGWIGIIIVIILSVFSLQQTSPNPLMYSILSEVESIMKNEERIVPTLSLYDTTEGAKIPTLEYPTGEIGDYKNVLLIVFEGVTSYDFENEFMKINGGFFESYKNKSIYYDNYYTTNLDSYTSLIAMMTGIQVPYQSYADQEIYDRVNDESNLVAYFNQNAFSTSFVSTFEYNPFIPSSTLWNNIFMRKYFDVDQWVSIGSSKMEMATEDKAAIVKIVSEVKENDKNFVMHEMAYGHSSEWETTTGITQLAYYDEYLRELSDKLRDSNLFENTLFVIVSDHGNRSKISDAQNYRVPLLIVGQDVHNSTNDTFLSHLDLPKIIYSFLHVGDHPTGVNMIYTVGSSGKWTYGAITKDNQYVFIDNAKGTILSESELDPVLVYTDFQKYINGFNQKYGKIDE